MPVRDSTEWRHAIIQKKVFNFDAWDPRAIICAWSDCEKPGYEMHKVVSHQGVQRGERTMNYVFCSDAHKRYWVDELHQNLRQSQR
jgi:hypothetical protein